MRPPRSPPQGVPRAARQRPQRRRAAIRIASAACAAALLPARATATAGCPGSSVPCHDDASQCCDAVWCGSPLTNRSAQACGDQADIPAERATPQGANNTCACFTSTEQGKGYKCVGIHCVRETVQCDGTLTELHQVCASASWPSGGVCRCQDGYSCTVEQPAAGADPGAPERRSCQSTRCELTIYGCERYRSDTRNPGEACECTGCAAGYALHDNGARCLGSVRCGESALAAGQCPSDSTLVDGVCTCSASSYCAATGTAAGTCRRRTEVQCGDRPTSTQICPRAAPVGADSGICTCSGATTCLANKTCGKEIADCGARLAAYQVCGAPATAVEAFCTCPVWARCVEGRCQQHRCEGDAIAGCGVYVSDTPGADGCLCRRCIGHGMGRILTDGGKVCRLEIACKQQPRPGTTDVCTAEAVVRDGVCECINPEDCTAAGRCDNAGLEEPPSPPPDQVVHIVSCGFELKQSANSKPDSPRYECTAMAQADPETLVCECSALHTCSPEGQCGRRAVPCGRNVTSAREFCRDTESYRNAHGTCTCSDDHLCRSGMCRPKALGAQLNGAENDRVARHFTLTVVGANRAELVGEGANGQTLAAALYAMVEQLDPVHLSRRPCRDMTVLTAPGRPPWTETASAAFAAERAACMQLTQLCDIDTFSGGRGTYTDARFSFDRDCVTCRCWYPGATSQGGPYSADATVTVLRRAGLRQAAGSAATPLTAANATTADLTARGSVLWSLGSDAAEALGSARIGLLVRASQAEPIELLPRGQQKVLVDSIAERLSDYFCNPGGSGVCRGRLLQAEGLPPLKVLEAQALLMGEEEQGVGDDPHDRALPQTPLLQLLDSESGAAPAACAATGSLLGAVLAAACL